MTTKRRSRRVQVQSSDTFVGTGVYAPSNVRARSQAAENAFALSEALGFAAQATGEFVERRNEREMQAGAEAAARGDFNEQELHELEKSAAFVYGAEQILAKERAIIDEAAAIEYYQTEVDKSLSPSEVDEVMDAWWKERYEGISTGMARLVLPNMQASRERILANHINMQTQETQDQLLEAQGTVMQDALRTDSYDHAVFREQSNRLLGKDATNQLITANAIEFAMSELDETVLDRDEWAMLREHRVYGPQIAQARAQVRTARIDARKAAETADRAFAYEGLRQMAEARDPSVIGLIYDSATPDAEGVAIISESEAQGLLKMYYDAGESEAITISMIDLIDQGLGGRDIPPAQYDEAFQAWVTAKQEQFAASNPDADPAAAAESLRVLTVERIAANGKMPGWMKRNLETASPTNEARFGEGYALYEEFEANHPGLVHSMINENAVRQFEMYDELSRDFGPEGALERMRNFDRSLVSEVTRDERDQAIGDIVDSVTDIPWSLREIQETPKLRRLVNDRFDYMIGLGLPVERAAEFAMNDLEQRFIIIDRQLYPASSPWGPNGNDAAEWYRGMQETHGTGPIRFDPVPGEPNFVYVTPEESVLPAAGERISIAAIANGYEGHLHAETVRAARDRNAEVRDEYIERAKDHLYGPDRTIRAGSEFFVQDQNRDARWEALPEAEQNMVIDRLVEQDQLDDEARRERGRRSMQNLQEAFENGAFQTF